MEEEATKRGAEKHEMHVLILGDKLFCRLFKLEEQSRESSNTSPRYTPTVRAQQAHVPVHTCILGITAGGFCLHIGHKIEIDPSECVELCQDGCLLENIFHIISAFTIFCLLWYNYRAI